MPLLVFAQLHAQPDQQQKREPLNFSRWSSSAYAFAKTNNGKNSGRVPSANDGSRSSKHPDADAVEIIYLVGTTPPASAKDCTNSFVSSKARFTLELGNENIGKKCYAHVRWINTSDNSKSGPRNGMLTATITE